MTLETFDADFDNGEVAVSGPALVEVVTARYNDADIGGSDGWETIAELQYLDLNGVHITRTQLVKIFGPAQIDAFEGRITATYPGGMEE